MKHVAALIVLVSLIVALGCGSAAADAFERYGLRPAALIITGQDEETFERVLRRAEELGARGLLAMPPSLVFARFPAGTGAGDFADLGVRFAAAADEIDPFSTDIVTLRSARALLESERILREAPVPPAEPFEDLLLRVPPEIVERTKVPGPRQGSPSQIVERAIDQNSEFLMGSVLINVVLPESDAGIEWWTDQEIAELLTDINLGLNQYVQQTHWVSLSFIVNCPPHHRRVPVSIEPIEGNWNSDWRWITDAMRALDVDPGYGGSLGMTHAYNNRTRIQRGTDWVFTAYIADASENECWLPLPDGSQYVAYAYLGGPYIVVPYPACRFGAGIGFAHVFIHEMSHIFWALDEYASAGQSCNATSGYLNYRNGNSYYGGFTGIPCGEGLPCIMNNAALTAPLPICKFTMGQVGLGDDNGNSIPDLYEIPPRIDLLKSPSQGDTTYDGSYLLIGRFRNEALPNMNPYIDASRRVSYAPKLVAGWMRINNGFWTAFVPSAGAWDGSEAELGTIINEGIDPGDNWIHFRVRNMVGLEARDSTRVIFIGIKFYENSASVETGAIRLSWKTAKQVFGAVFDVRREDLTGGGPELVLATIDGNAPVEEGATRKVFMYLDETVEPGHEYRYRIVGRMLGREYSSRAMVRIATIPFAGRLLSPLAPNPIDQRGTRFSIRVPKSYHDPSGAAPATSRGIWMAPALQEIKTPVEVDVFDVTGRKVRGIYSLSIFGGEDLTLDWDGFDDGGRAVAAGVYFIRVRAGSMQEVRKAVILR